MSSIFDPDQMTKAITATSLALDGMLAMQRAANERIAFLEMLLAGRDVQIARLNLELEAEGREVERLRAGIGRVLGRAA